MYRFHTSLSVPPLLSTDTISLGRLFTVSLCTFNISSCEFQILSDPFFSLCAQQVLILNSDCRSHYCSYFSLKLSTCSVNVVSASFRRTPLLLPEVSLSSLKKIPSIQHYVGILIWYSGSAGFYLFLRKYSLYRKISYFIYNKIKFIFIIKMYTLNSISGT